MEADPALISPNKLYLPETNPDAFCYLAAVAQATLDWSTNKSTIRIGGEDIGEIACVSFTSIDDYGDHDLAHEMITIQLQHLSRTEDSCGESYEVRVSRTIPGYDEHDAPAIVRDIVLFCPDDPDEVGTAAQIYDMPNYDVEQIAPGDTVDEAGKKHFCDFVKRINATYLSWSRLSRFEMNEITELMVRYRDIAVNENQRMI